MRAERSIKVFSANSTVVTSAKSRNLQEGAIKGKSLIYRRKSKGPEHYLEEPRPIFAHEEELPLILTY